MIRIQRGESSDYFLFSLFSQLTMCDHDSASRGLRVVTTSVLWRYWERSGLWIMEAERRPAPGMNGPGSCHNCGSSNVMISNTGFLPS